jgi:hypothetical protein
METQPFLTMKPATNFSLSLELMRRFLGNISLALLIAFSLQSKTLYANITSVVTTPAVATVPAKGSASLNITWRVLRLDPGNGGTVPVTSSAAILQIQGNNIATFNNSLSTTSTLPPGQSTTLQFQETLTLSVALTRRIADSPVGSVRIIRTFDDTQVANSGQLRLAAGQSNTIPLTVRRIDLSFDSKARTDVIQQGESLRAIVDLSYRSSGVLRGEWRLIDPSASLGQTGGRILQVVQKNLVSSGEGRTRIISPPLPSQQTGLYILAFAIQQGDTGVETPILRYFVLDKTRDNASQVDSITTLSPAGRATLSKSTVFSWQPVNNAHAYQVAVFNKGDTTPISGKLITAQQSQLTLSTFSQEWLLPGYEYSWQVRAFDQQGNLVASSSISDLYLPE